MNVPTDRLLIMVVVATGFAVVVGGWAAGLIRAEATGIEEWALRAGVGVLFLLVLVIAWTGFSRIDAKRG
ncbi:hypothetical protein [Halovivax sp.]|uniref:hypothetical protein n=1 Tax=Halovivax sp. TaxID=1935978 RepID=UPI0025BF8CE2|nr:hypothetical protein [Halovivax sp.]